MFRTVSSNEPGPVTFPEGVRICRIASGRHHVVALSTNNELFGWGKNENGQVTFIIWMMVFFFLYFLFFFVLDWDCWRTRPVSSQAHFRGRLGRREDQDVRLRAQPHGGRAGQRHAVGVRPKRGRAARISGPRRPPRAGAAACEKQKAERETWVHSTSNLYFLRISTV